MGVEKVLTFKGSVESLEEKNLAKILKRAFDIVGEDLQVLGMNRLVPGQVIYTLVTEEEFARRQEQLHHSCRNSLGSFVEAVQ